MKFVLGIVVGLVLAAIGYCLYTCTLSNDRNISVAVGQPELLDVFRFTLEDEVKKRLTVPEAGYTPEHLLQIFPGLVDSDFRGVAASGGVYVVNDGVLVFERDESGLVPETVGGLNRNGYQTLLQNVTDRLGVSLASTGTITDVMTAIAKTR